MGMEIGTKNTGISKHKKLNLIVSLSEMINVHVKLLFLVFRLV